MCPMHVLVIGGTRFVGYLLVFRLIAGGHRVTILNRGHLADPFGDRVERLRCDRTTADFARLLQGREFDAVVDFAAYRAEDVVSAMETLGGRLGHYVFIGTGQVYLVREGCPKPSKEEDYDGRVIAAPEGDDKAQWDYGVDKRACEDELVAGWQNARFPSTRIRIPMVNGERDYHRRFEEYLWRILDGGPIVLPDGGTHPVRHVYGGEVARFITEILGKADTFGQAYNLCQEETPTLAELLALVSAMMGAPPRMVAVPAGAIVGAGLVPRQISPFSGRWMSMLDPSKVKTQLGFRHESVESYAGKIVASFLAHPPSSPPDGYLQRAKEIELVKGFCKSSG